MIGPGDIPRAHPRAHALRHRAYAGTTFLEVVFAIAALGLLTATIMAAVGYVHGRQRTEQRRLASAELANRLVLSFLDANAHLSPDTLMPSPSLPIAYGADLYRWDMQIDEIRIEEVDRVQEAVESGRQSPVSRDRFKQLTLRVWLSEQSGGVRRFESRDGGTPRAVLIRVFDPLAGRNPDAAERLLENPGAARQFVNEVIGGG